MAELVVHAGARNVYGALVGSLGELVHLGVVCVSAALEIRLPVLCVVVCNASNTLDA